MHECGETDAELYAEQEVIVCVIVKVRAAHRIEVGNGQSSFLVCGSSAQLLTTF